MSKTKTKKTVAAPKTAGRPAAFPGQTLVSVLTNIPIETRQMLRELAVKRGETMNVVIDRFIQNGYKAAMRTRSKKE